MSTISNVYFVVVQPGPVSSTPNPHSSRAYSVEAAVTVALGHFGNFLPGVFTSDSHL